jgi:AAA15 family ATPase/GTPase
MFIHKFQLLNYKSYIDSEELEFSPGINVIIGQNNSGKTALLEALSLRLSSNPHRSTQTLPTAFSKIDEQSSAKITLTIDNHELRKLLEQLPPPLGISEPDHDMWNSEPELVKSYISNWDKNLSDKVPIELNISLSSETNKEVKYFSSSRLLDKFRWTDDKQYSYMEIYQNKDGIISANLISEYVEHDSEMGYGDFELVDYKKFQGTYKESISYKIFDLFRNRIYRFYAERLNVSRCSYKNTSELNPDASNLAEVLHLLPTKNPSNFSRLNKYISTIFPHIEYISSVSKEDSIVEIIIWTVDASRENREDLTLPLSACGTGLSQVIAILYVVITSVIPRTIIIDEPQSFLHPGAAKKLIEILKEFPQHQYFIATHSPMLITAAYPSNIIKVVHDGIKSEAFVIKPEEIEEQLGILDEVGASLSDVFGADNILWVEGQTEEKCFPLILEKVAKKPLRGTFIIRVQTTGELEGKNARLIFDIYDRLSGGNYLLPPVIKFILDKEGKTPNQIAELKKRSNKLLEFLPRRMYENYLLLPEAIAYVINYYDTERNTPVDKVEVNEWIDKKKQARKYIKNDVIDSDWANEVDASKLLKELFVELSETRVDFKKPLHPYEITKWIIANQPEYLLDLAQFLKNILDGRNVESN